MMLSVGDKLGQWIVLKYLGVGGQGTVYRVRSQEGRGEGALKLFAIPRSKRRRAEALNRLEREVEILRRLDHPNIVKLLDANIKDRWITMEYLPNGTLADHLSVYRGRAVAALQKFRPLVEGVALLHHLCLVHRDIKLQNIFVAQNGGLVLGDFGLAFENSALMSRITMTNERVGSRDWIAPWADVRKRIENPNPTLDVFSLSKVLWCMLSGMSSLPLWYHQKDTYDLERLFQNQMVEQVREGRTPHMAAINWILNCCIVENEEDCRVPSAKRLLGLVDSFLWAWSELPERGSHWRNYYSERAKELYDGLTAEDRRRLTIGYRTAYLAREGTLPGDVFIDWNVQAEIMDDLTRDETSMERRDVNIWPEVVAKYFQATSSNAPSSI
jgi:serine/threonine protein kinase